MDSLIFYFLLLAAVFSGWLMGRFIYPRGRKSSKESSDLFEDYFVGLNYLLNDEPDEAIDTFIDALEINSETIETHLALGALLRRRGKVDKAIKVHQALLARVGLEQGFSDATKLQLSLDHIAAGLLDRAERLLNEILAEADSNSKCEALIQLITVYKTEKEWEKAIESSNLLLADPAFKKNPEIRSAAAHFCCEFSEQLLETEQYSEARTQLKRAFGFDKENTRTLFLSAEIERRQGNFKPAIKQLMRIHNSSPEFVGLILKPLAECYQRLGSTQDFEKLLRNMLAEHPDVHVVLTLAELITEDGGDEAAMHFLNECLTQHPSLEGLLKLLGLQISSVDDEFARSLGSARDLISKILNKNFEYQCNHCGFESKNHYWMCPSCKKWDKIKPIQDSAVS